MVEKELIWNYIVHISSFSTIDNIQYIHSLATLLGTRTVTLLDFSYHGYCGHKNSQYRYITVSIETLEGGGDISQIIFYFVYWVCIFHQINIRKLINVGHKTLRESHSVFFGAPMK